MTLTVTEVGTPIGALRVVWDDDAVGVDAAGKQHRGAVVRTQFGRSLRPEGSHFVRADAAPAGLALVVAAVRAWSDGSDRDALAAVPVSQEGGEFRQRCWQALRGVRAGSIVSYVELAGLAGNPRASRAAGSAMATNAVAPFVPCHRVVRTDGVIGNYSAAKGSESKAALLAHEGVVLT